MKGSSAQSMSRAHLAERGCPAREATTRKESHSFGWVLLSHISKLRSVRSEVRGILILKLGGGDATCPGIAGSRRVVAPNISTQDESPPNQLVRGDL